MKQKPNSENNKTANGKANGAGYNTTNKYLSTIQGILLSQSFLIGFFGGVILF